MPSEEVVLHLVDFFFKYINSIFPLVHHATLVQSIKDGSISPPLLWSVMAIGARFSDHPDIKTDPPYWAGEKFARKAGALISNDLFEPTVPNLQFWGVMACLEYGRAAGSRAWIYGGLAARICFELGFHKEETLKLPVYKKDGTMDRVAMLMRRRIFWSCFNIDKYGSAGNSRPQFFSKGDYDVGLPDEESLALLNPIHQNVTVDYKPVKADSLGSFVRHYLTLMELFGMVIKGMQRAKANNKNNTEQQSTVWPPMDDFDQLNDALMDWKNGLPDHYDFSHQDLEFHLERASRGKINHYLCAHVIWRTLVLALHRGSLAYIDHQHQQSSNNNTQLQQQFSSSTWDRINESVAMCKRVVHEVMPIFQAMKDICSVNVIPYMGYSSYMFATILMTSTFTKTEEQHRKGTKGLLLLYDMIELLRPYWPVCERLSSTTRDLIVQHSKMYEYSQEEHHKRTGYELPSSPHQQQHPFPSYNTPTNEDALPPPPAPPQQQQSLPTTSFGGGPPVSMPGLVSPATPYPYSLPVTTATDIPQSFDLPDTFPGSGATTIDFNSSAFLYDTGLFGQIMFDETKAMGMLQENPLVCPTTSSSSQQQQQPANHRTTDRPSFLPPQTQPQAQTTPIMNYDKQRPWDPVWRT
ncbi:fungal-specific transcription factor domain-domain-containing protein [Absidia repens]|uniref:Fungal-specific transcription factor domain-domain-containing protein n=1 Tax=Absidia repens TaxID=90262 RepID=A0A1X2I8B4_9FUNG|nr:fungal-specific transcription factor domain-domain-containing protein [Absidia repens]